MQSSKIHLLFVVSLLALNLSEVRAIQASINPTDMCKLYVENKVLNFTGINYHQDLFLNYKEQQTGEKYILVASLCHPLNIEDVKLKIPEDKRGTTIYRPSPDNKRPNVVMIKRTKEDKYEIIDLAYINSDQQDKWLAIPHYNTSDAWQRPETYSVELFYDISENQAAQELGLSNIQFRNICLKDDDFEFYDERVEGGSIIFQYNGKKACELTIDRHSYYLEYINSVIVFIASAIGLFLGSDNERVALPIASLQGAFMVMVATDLTIRSYIPQSEESIHNKLYYFFIRLLLIVGSVGFSYFSRYVSIFFLCAASTYAVNWSLLYLVTLLFKVGIPFWLFHVGSMIVGIALVLLAYYSASFREKYAFAINTAVTNSFYLCFTIEFILGWYLDIFNFNSFKQFGKYDIIEVKNWILFVMQLTLTLVMITFRIHRAKKNKMEAMRKNQFLFRSTAFAAGGDYTEPEDRGEDGATVIAM